MGYFVFFFVNSELSSAADAGGDSRSSINGIIFQQPSATHQHSGSTDYISKCERTTCHDDSPCTCTNVQKVGTKRWVQMVLISQTWVSQNGMNWTGTTCSFRLNEILIPLRLFMGRMLVFASFRGRIHVVSRSSSPHSHARPSLLGR